MEWISVEDRLPENGTAVLLYYKNQYNKKRIVRGCYLERYTLESNCEDDANDEYCMDDDIYYICEGWYEYIDNWSDFASVFIHEGDVTHWRPLPDPPEAEKNESSI